ncbi:MAG TPA: type II secretion system F family protein [Candidatus Norongarragalinales archaeon]|nr:type II secretion system F family protein [Candidatus Norongarragalinales archaeon]
MNLLAFLVDGFSFADAPLDLHSLKRLERDLLQASLSFNARKYASFCFSFSSALAILAFLFSMAFVPIFSSMAFSAFAFTAVFFCSLHYPALAKKRRAEEIERDLPLFLRNASVDLGLGMAFEKMLESACDGYGELSREMRKAVGEISSGRPVQQSLLGLASRVDGLSVKRSVMQLCFSYENGFDGEGLRKLADEFIQQQRIKSREFAAKQAFFGLLFIAASTIVPALFSAYVMVGSAFLSLTFSATDIVIFFAFVFPLADLAILLYLSEAKPKIL